MRSEQEPTLGFRVFRAGFLLVILFASGLLLWWLAGNLAWHAPMGWYIRSRDYSSRHPSVTYLYSRTRYATPESCRSALAKIPETTFPKGAFCARERVYDAQNEMLDPFIRPR